MVWWEAVLSPALQVLFDKLASGDIVDFLQDSSIGEFLLDKLKIAYFANLAVLEDAELKKHHDPAVGTWLDMLKDAVFDAEDLLDEMATEALRCQLGSINQVRPWNLITSSFRGSEGGGGSDRDGLEARMAKVVNKLEYIANQKDVLGLKLRGDYGGRAKFPIRRFPTTAVLMESRVFGRDGNREEFVKLLLGSDGGIGGSDEVPVIPLLGMGGVGKTVLAQLVFNDVRVKDYFDVKAWACVSDEFDPVKVMKSVLESATNRPWETANLELLQSSLTKSLSKKKFLIVLDDLWIENPGDWHELRLPFLVGARGSRIIITTRSQSVVNSVNSCQCPPYHLTELSDDSCWSLLSHYAFRDQTDSMVSSKLEATGRQVAKRCKGLPLAAKAIGSLLGSKLEIGFWREILNSDLWDISSRGSSKNAGIFPALQLSYDHLPANLKRCFAYCSIFPKGYQFEREKLVLLWMAEGFIHEREDNRSMEEVGRQYFTDLVSRSFFQWSEGDHESKFIMHDLISDLARFVSRKNQRPLLAKARHFSYAQGKYDVYKKFDSLSGNERLRTFLPLSPYQTGFCYLSSKVITDILPGLRCLRVLSLSGYCINELPEKIGDMKLLRYLDLSRTAIKFLPETISTLCNLQTLMLNDCDSLLELPDDFSDLINLQHLDISGSGVQYMPLNMSKMRSLRTLPEFIVGNRIGSDIGDIRDLVHLKGKIVLSRLENVADPWDARKANLASKKGLDEVAMEWSSNFDELQDPMVQTAIFEMLQPPRKVERLRIRYFNGTRFSTWLGDPSFASTVFLNLEHCRKCSVLPPLGQLSSLKELYIKGLSSVKSVGSEFYGDSYTPFPSLEILSFRDMLEWEHWTSSRAGEQAEIKAFPSLREVYIEQCDKLTGNLPSHLPSLEKLVIHGTQKWSVPLPGLESLRHLDIKGCPEVLLRRATLDLSSLSCLNISGISNLTHLPSETMQGLKQLEVLQITDCPELKYLSREELGFVYLSSLRSLIVRHCPVLVSLFKKETQLPAELKYLELENCLSLRNLPENLHGMTLLRELTIKDCPELVSFPGSSFPPMLRGLVIRQSGLLLLPREMIQSTRSCLEYLYISGCYDLTSFPSSVGHVAPTTFQQLVIDHCPNLQSLPSGIMLGSNVFLAVLEIFDCSSLASLPLGQLPATLKTLTIFNCSSLETLSEILDQENRNTALESFRVGKCTSLKHLPNGLHKLSSLEYLEIDWCPLLEFFPEGGLPAANLKKVRITGCENLQALPSGMQNLTSLQELSISDCPRIVSLPERGLPISLTSLEIKDCDGISDLSEWSLHRLDSLKKLSIVGGSLGLSNFPEWMLPPSLTSLQLGKLPNLDFRTSWLQNLTLLEDLKLKDCKKLRDLPVEGLPAALSRLEVQGCPLIEQQCEREWEKIDHIPCILM